VVKSGTTLTAARAERLIARGWHEACRIPAGPVHLDIPTDEARRPARGRPVDPPADSSAGPSASTIRAAARLMTRRGRAVVVAGMGCRGPRAVRALRELVGHLGSPVLTTPKAKGVLPEDHPLSAGVFMGGKLDSELLGRADTILVAGVDPVELLARPWRVGAEVVLLAEYRIGARPFRPSVEVVADLADGLEALRAALPPAGEWGLANWAAQARVFKGEVRERLAEADRGRGGIAPHRVVSLVREAAPRETRVAVDSGGHALLVASFWESYTPGGYLCSGGLSAPGYALPAAVAAGLVEPGVPLVAFIGDGGLLMSLGSLATAAKRKIPLTVVVFVDASLNLIRALQERRRYAPLGIALPEIGIPEVAAGLGALGISVETEAELTDALHEAFAARQPAVIGVRVRPGGYRRMLDTLWGAPTA
jgi:acetolactate synthase-1/2/3 large subunit